MQSQKTNKTSGEKPPKTNNDINDEIEALGFESERSHQLHNNLTKGQKQQSIDGFVTKNPDLLSSAKNNTLNQSIKETRTVHIIKNTLKNQLRERNVNSIENMENMEDLLSLDVLQKLMVDSVSDNVKKKEQEEMKKMSENIWIQRNKYKVETRTKGQENLQSQTTPRQGANRLKMLLQENLMANVEQKKQEEALLKKKQYLSKKTKEVVKEIPEFMMSFNDSRRVRWDTFVIVLTIYNCFYIPFEISFQPPVDYTIEVINSVIDLIFYIDIILNLRTTYMTEEGEEITDKKKIAKRYILKSTFFVDVMSILPLNAIIPGDFKYLDAIGMLKLVRISRLGKLIQKLDLREDIKAMVRVCQLTFLLIFYFHLCTCLWFIEARIYEVWIPAIEFGTLQTDVFQASIEKQYFTTMHYSVLLLTGNEMGPRTDFENFLCTLYILCGALISANIFGEMAVLVQMIKRKSQWFQEQIDSANTAMKNIRLPGDLSSEIRDYLVFTQSTLDQQQELDKFLSLISPSLKLKVSWQIFEGVIKENPVFRTIKPVETNILPLMNMARIKSKQIKQEDIQNGQGTDLVSIVVRKLQIQLNGPEDIIIRQGEDTQDIYFIAKGDNYVSIKETQKREYKNFKKLVPGDHFGEISLIYGCPRSATIMSGNYCTYAKLPIENYKLLLSEIPEVEESFRKYTFSYDDKHKSWMIKTLRQLPFFCDIEEWTLHRLIYSFKKRVLDKGAVIFKSGEEVQQLRLVQDGIIDVFTYFENKEFVIEKLMRGSILNYRSFFLEESAQVFARAAKTSIILEISLEELNSLLPDSPIFEKKFLSYQTKILNTGKSFPIDYLLKVPKNNIIDPKITTPERIKRMVLFKLGGNHLIHLIDHIVMRRIQELRIQKSKPKLSDLLKELKKGGPVQRMEVKRKILALYEFDDQEKAEQMKDKKNEDDVLMDKEDQNEKNQTFLSIKMKVKKIMKELENQEKALEVINGKMLSYKSRVHPSAELSRR